MVMQMAKKGMRRYFVTEPTEVREKRVHMPKNEVPPVPEISGKAKAGHEKAAPAGEHRHDNV